ncbi:uncharacterized protein DSM5745_08443 [Aspergillus mulundensis]|uniref:Uncharacterized protein n=1 Tax=Aspergillus mulundensis TaxID=1810919 RepID=A0A3D8R3P8_9EURO|nr:hypothetical protein DSM5745_08443 [Aspergillus mulundensis]RDW68683.1 hypothetical protein DSM5745_08443 [Aspergillus mulundensis]
MTRFLGAVAALTRPLQELAFRDMQNVNPTDTQTVADLMKVLGNLRSPRLNVTNYSPSETSDINVSPAGSFSDTGTKNAAILQQIALILAQTHNVQSATLDGVLSPPRRLFAQGNYTFMYDSQLEWIISHGQTLSELYMDECMIFHKAALYYKVVGDTPLKETVLSLQEFRPHPDLPDNQVYASYSRRWADYFLAFQHGLPHLRHFRFGSSPDWWTDGTTPFDRETEVKIGFHRECYMTFCDGTLPTAYHRKMISGWEENGQRRRRVEKALLSSQEDRRALVVLCEKIGQSVVLHKRDFLKPA